MPTWYKLDNAAKIYPPSATRRWQAMFRLSVTLTEAVDPEVLAQAHESTLPRFPSFAVRLRRGFFWYYLERVEGTPPLKPDVRNPMERLNVRANGGFQYRLLYYNNRIALEFFHVLADGSGGMAFLLTLVNEYLRILHGVDVSPAKYILRLDEEPTAEEQEDAFARYAQGPGYVRKESPAYHPKGSAVPLGRLLLVSGEVPTDALLAKAKEYGVTLGVFLNAVYAQAVHEHQLTEKSRRRRKLPVKVCTPVNLRQFFPSATLRNFSAFANPGIDTRLGEYTFEETLRQMQHQMGAQLNAKEYGAWMASNVNAERNPLVRAVPLPLKKQILRAAHRLQGDRFSSVTLSNLGLLRLPEELATFVDRVDFFLGRAVGKRSQAGCVSYNGRTFIDFSRNFAELDIERRFFTQLVRMGIPVKVESNGTVQPLVGGDVFTAAGLPSAASPATHESGESQTVNPTTSAKE